MNGSTANRATWTQQFAIAAAYAACYELARYLSFSHWMLTAGLRLACLLLVPVRFWPALILGEALPAFENALLNEPQFGQAWALSAAVPMVLLWIPVVRPLRQRWPLFAADGTLRVGTLLTATLGCTVVNAVATCMTLEAALLSNIGAWPEISVGTYFWAYMLGGYLGALTLTPTVLALHERANAVAHVSFAGVWRSKLARDLVAWTLPVCGGLAWMALATDDDLLRQIARLALLLPVFALALRHGWHGTAVGGMLASVALAATGTTLLDPAMIRCQAVLALCISGTLLIGSRVTRRATQAPPAARASR
ncbi:two-component system sensor histidine kinase UhpB [Luteibacter sp. 621]|uniref:MASE1 domain-containing protein n=1 Tax=Luteibacter sp. 621 TaxID=3373916 RepID=UPI003D1FB1B0